MRRGGSCGLPKGDGDVYPPANPPNPPVHVSGTTSESVTIAMGADLLLPLNL